MQMAGALLFPDEKHTVELGGALHPLEITWQGPQSLGQYTKGCRTVLLTDRNVAGPHLERYRRELDDPLVLTINPGESKKSLNTAKSLYQALLDARMERGDLLVALGGGMITDLGAFVASTYKRGMQVVLVSTSLLGCVDAAIGGKSGVNLGPAKNVIGCFCVPQAVILDLQALGTLPRRQIAEGLVEAYKTGLVKSPELAVLIQENLKHFLAGDLFYMAQAAKLSALCKTEVVKADFKEMGVRRILNLGHTYGHALEGFNRYRVSHGRSVAAGIMVDAAISAKRGLITEQLYKRIADTMRPLAPRPPAWPTAEDAWELMQNDKKNQNRRILFILLEGLGKAAWVDDVHPAGVEKGPALCPGWLRWAAFSANICEPPPLANPTARPWAWWWKGFPRAWGWTPSAFSMSWTAGGPAPPPLSPPARKPTRWRFSPGWRTARPWAPPSPFWCATATRAPRITGKRPRFSAPDTRITPISRNTACLPSPEEAAPRGARPWAGWPPGRWPRRSWSPRG